MTKKEIRARLKQLEKEIKSAAGARDALSNNGCWAAVDNANDRLRQLAQERDSLQRLLKETP